MATYSNPFPGIRSYEPEESDLFFGREASINDILNVLFDKQFIAIVGASGSGKSSLIKAGVIPKLEKSRQHEQWKKITFRPGNNPIRSFAEELYNFLKSQTTHYFDLEVDDIFAELNKGIDGFINIFSTINKVYNSQWLIYVDQFEEIFRYKFHEDAVTNYESANKFIQLILNIISQTKIPTFVILSLRSDFLGDCAEFSGLVETINRGNYLVPRMTTDEKRRAITEPVSKMGGSIAQHLVDLLIHDIGDSQDQLLVMQHALMRTWEYWIKNKVGDQPIDIQHYEAIGAMKKALSYHGEQIYFDIPEPANRLIAEKIFKALINIGVEGRGTRRPTFFKEICIIANATEDNVKDVIDRFRDPQNCFLTPNLQVAITDKTVIDISHESVVKIWGRAKEWVDEETKSVELYLRLSKSSELYQMGKTGLWINPDLELALKWYTHNKPNQTWAARYAPAFERAITYLNYSKTEYENSVKLKEDRQKRKLRFARNFALFLGAASIVSILFLVVALNLRYEAVSSERKALEKEKIALQESKIAEEKTKEAIAQEKIAQQQQIIAQQQKLLAEEQKKYAISQQEIALFEKNAADIARNEALMRRHQAEISQSLAEKAKRHADSLRVIAVDQQIISGRLSTLAIAKSLAIQAIEMFQTRNEQNGLASIFALQAYQFIKANKGNTNDPNIFEALMYASGDKKVLLGHTAKVRSIFLDANNDFVSCSDDGTIRKWNTERNESKLVINTGEELRSVVSIPQKNMVVSGSYNGKIVGWDVSASPFKPRVIARLNGAVNAMTYHANGYLAASDTKGTLIIWNELKASADTINDFLGTKINTLSFSIDGSILACGCENGMIKLYYPAAKTNYVLQKYGDGITAIAFSLSQMMATATNRNEVKLWDLVKNQSVILDVRHASRINALCFSPVNANLASCSYDGTIKIMDYADNLQEPRIIKGHDDWIYDIAYTSDGNHLISAGNDKTIRIWGINSELLARKVKLNRNLTKDEWNKYIGEAIPYQETKVD